MLGLQLLPHRERRGRLVERLIRLYGHLDLVADAQEQDPPLELVDRHLSYDFFKTLLEEFLAHGADARLSCLPLRQLLVQEAAQTRHV